MVNTSRQCSTNPRRGGYTWMLERGVDLHQHLDLEGMRRLDWFQLKTGTHQSGSCKCIMYI